MPFVPTLASQALGENAKMVKKNTRNIISGMLFHAPDSSSFEANLKFDAFIIIKVIENKILLYTTNERLNLLNER